MNRFVKAIATFLTHTRPVWCLDHDINADLIAAGL
jgi:hypothetical protein